MHIFIKVIGAELHLLIIILGTNLVSNIGTKASNRALYSIPNLHFHSANKVQMLCTFWLGAVQNVTLCDEFNVLFITSSPHTNVNIYPKH